jgi:quinol monooxygenase YgiN
MFAKHPVQNYDNWKTVYDELGPTRQAMGVVGASVHQDPNDPTLITITHRFNDLNAAHAFANSDELKMAMQNAGVAGPPDIWFTEDVERTKY